MRHDTPFPCTHLYTFWTPQFPKLHTYLKVMKRAASCKHRQTVKKKQCEKKLFKSHLHSSKLGQKSWETCDFYKSEDGSQHGKPSCPLVVVKTKVKSAFLMWHHHGDTNTAFQLKLANFLVTQPTFMIV